MDKVKCDLCGKEVGAASLYQRVGFTAHSRTSKVCGSCFSDKLNRDERLRFRKGAAPKAKTKKADDPQPELEEEDRWPEQPDRPPEDLRF